MEMFPCLSRYFVSAEIITDVSIPSIVKRLTRKRSPLKPDGIANGFKRPHVSALKHFGEYPPFKICRK
ncbi:hypothetical protein PUN4_1100008 [Paraburkholderia unamae]|nr:hypothetical protein PUN4_1100008 [Paraburkholderia unamae]